MSLDLIPLKQSNAPHLHNRVCVEVMNSFPSTTDEERDGGYFTHADRNYNHKYYCGACGQLMRDPVQTECGHRFCKACHKTALKELKMCPSCLREKDILENVSIVMFEKCFKDRAIEKEILNLEVACPNQGCTWTGPLREFEEKHKMNCEQNLQRCPFSVAGCKEMISSHQMDEHIQASVQHHLNCILRCLQEIKKVPSESLTPKGTIEDLKIEETKPPEWRKELSQGETAQEELKVKLQTFENIVTVLNREVGHTLNTVSEREKWIKEQDSEIAQLKRKVRQNEKSIYLKDVVIAELQLHLEVLENTSHDGSFTWRISDVSRKMKDARDGRTTSVLSPPFYTSRCGYKLCLRMYLNGDGLGANTHLSLFLVIMKGKYDLILEWPFSKKVTFKLLDQCNRDHHVISAFKPDINSASFLRPTRSMNVASGCPQFLTLAHLRSNWHHYVAEDTMFIQAIVEG